MLQLYLDIPSTTFVSYINIFRQSCLPEARLLLLENGSVIFAMRKYFVA